jgi:hypothetical protein
MSSRATIRKKLRDELSKRLVPALHALGFDGPDRITGNALLHSYRRAAADGVQCLHIHFDKWQRPRSALEFWTEPPGGIASLMQRGGEFIQGRRLRGVVGEPSHGFVLTVLGGNSYLA